MRQLVALFIFMVFSVSSFAQSEIVIEGKSSVKLVPEQLIFTMNMSVKDSVYTKCANLAIEKIEKIKSEFTKHGIDKDLIRTQNYSIREIKRHDYKTKKSVFDGFEASIPITIKTTKDYNKNDQIFEIIKNNFEANFNLNFALTPEQIEAVKEKLITLAVEDAKQKVKVISQSADVKIGKISKIQYGEPRTIRGFNSSNDLMKAGNMMQMESSERIVEILNPNEIEMRTNITMAWEIED